MGELDDIEARAKAYRMQDACTERPTEVACAVIGRLGEAPLPFQKASEPLV